MGGCVARSPVGLARLTQAVGDGDGIPRALGNPFRGTAGRFGGGVTMMTRYAAGCASDDLTPREPGGAVQLLGGLPDVGDVG